MSDDGDTTLNTKGLDAILKSLKTLPTSRIGILGSKNNRKDSGSNASIGMAHEFGEVVELNGQQIKLPERSFLRVPLIEQYQKALDEAEGFDQNLINEIIATKSLVELTKKLGILAEAVIKEAFHTGGFGKWKPSNMTFKKNHETLVETQQLRDSIISDVIE